MELWTTALPGSLASPVGEECRLLRIKTVTKFAPKPFSYCKGRKEGREEDNYSPQGSRLKPQAGEVQRLLLCHKVCAQPFCRTDRVAVASSSVDSHTTGTRRPRLSVHAESFHSEQVCMFTGTGTGTVSVSVLTETGTEHQEKIVDMFHDMLVY